MSLGICVRRFPFLLAGLATAFAADPPAADSGAQLPPVFFNHTDIFLDPAVYDAIAQSPFLKDEFSYFSESTITRPEGGGTYSYTFVGISGKQTYFSFLKLGQLDWRQLPFPRDQINFNMWIDDRTKLPLIRESLARQTLTKPTIQPVQFFVDGRGVNSLDSTSAEFPNDPENVRTATSVISRYPDSLRQRYPNVKPEMYGTTREKDQALGGRYVPGRLLNDITRFTLTANKAEAEQLIQEFRACGYAIRRDGEKQIAAGPEIEFVLLNAEPGAPRKLAIDMKLNRAKTGDQSYQFGSGSELRFNGDTATWYFPAEWRP
jgi:hypothetical protein